MACACSSEKIPVCPSFRSTGPFRGGLLAEKAVNNGITKLMARSMLKGTTTRTANQIAGQIESAGGSIAADSGNNSFSIAADVMKPDLALGLDIVADVLEHPTFPEAEVDLEKRGQLAGIKAEDEQITSVARNAMRAAPLRHAPLWVAHQRLRGLGGEPYGE